MTSYAITNAMKLKRKFGMGMKKKNTPISLKNIVKVAKKSIVSGKCTKKVIKSALKGAREAVKKAAGKQNIIIPRILPVPPKVSGFLPSLIPLFAGLSAAGALAGRAAGIAKAVNDSQTTKLQLEETQRHNRVMENGGNGLHLTPHKTGLGIHRGPKNKFKIKLLKLALTDHDLLKYAKELKIPNIRGVLCLTNCHLPAHIIASQP